MRRNSLPLYAVTKRRTHLPVYALALAAAVLVSPSLAHATTTGGSLPWDTPLQTLETDIKGPVAYGLALLGIVASGGMLIFGGEISEFTRRIMYVVLVAAIILGAASLLTTLFTTAALVSYLFNIMVTEDMVLQPWQGMQPLTYGTPGRNN